MPYCISRENINYFEFCLYGNSKIEKILPSIGTAWLQIKLQLLNGRLAVSAKS
jgi:hypothetical protein